MASRKKAGVLLVALAMSTVPGIFGCMLRAAGDSGYPSCCSSPSCPMHGAQPAMPARCPMGSQSPHSHGAKDCTCAVSQDPSPAAVAQPDFRFDLPCSFSPTLPWRSARRPAPVRVALLSGYSTPPDQPPEPLS
ncbi:MAG TPA: hypothetical protein VG204_19595 [Terriglobia bacterium]|nr:hypothetical protein [Terriglobia bacterium]